MRGIRELDVDLERKNFVISGPNGSGKSGVVDGIQFALTGEISRLAGKGTVGLTVQRHGPHVDRRDDPEVATVSLKFFMPETGRTAVLTRNMKKPKSFSLVPDDADVRALLKEVAEHPELTLSRREIIKYILVEAGERSKEIQALLKLDEIGKLRSTLNAAKNRLANAEMTANKAVSNANDALRRHLDAESLSKEEVLASVNKHRKVLDLPVIGELTTDTSLNSGVSEGVSQKAFNKESALRDLRALQEAYGTFGRLCKEETAAIVVDLQEIQNDPALLEIIQRHSFVEQGLAFVEGANCPLCDWEWENEEHLMEHLKTKLAKSEEVERVKKRLLDNARVIANEARRIVGLVRATQSISKVDGPDGFPTELESWSEHLTNLADALGTVEGALGQKACLEEGWVAAPDALTDNLDAVIGAVKAKPDQTASVSAQTFLTLAQDRLAARRRAQRVEKAAAAAATASATAYRTYCDVADEQLRLLYEEVEGRFQHVL